MCSSLAYIYPTHFSSKKNPINKSTIVGLTSINLQKKNHKNPLLKSTILYYMYGNI